MKIPKFLRKKRNIWIVAIIVVVIIIGYLIFGRGGAPSSTQTGVVSSQNLQETVLATGQVVSGTDLDLGFQAGGVVSRVYIKVGDTVSAGQTLAVLNQSSALATLTSARGSLAQAQANFEKLIAGTTPEDKQVYEDSVASAQSTLDGDYSSALSILNDAYSKIYTSSVTADSIQETYFFSADAPSSKVQDSKIDIGNAVQNVKSYLNAVQNSQTPAEIDFSLSGAIKSLSDIYNGLRIIREQCDEGIYNNTVSSTDKTSIDTQKTVINTALASVTTSQRGIASDKISLQKAQHQLDVQKAPPTQAEVDYARAQISSAQGQVDSASATLNNLIILAPSAGTITEVDVKVGEQASAMVKAIVLQDINNLHAEANVSEANIASIAVGQSIDYTFDALGPDQHFAGKVLSVNPASTVISGVVDYQIKGSLDDMPGIKPGMTANMTILAAQKENVLTVPSSAIINKDSKKYVRVVDDLKNLTYHEVEVKTGLNGDGGLVEIVSGLNDGQAIVVYMKQ